MFQAADLLARFSIHDIGVMIRQPIGHNTVGRHDAPRHRDGYVVDRERPRPPVRERRGGHNQAHRVDHVANRRVTAGRTNRLPAAH